MISPLACLCIYFPAPWPKASSRTIRTWCCFSTWPSCFSGNLWKVIVSSKLCQWTCLAITVSAIRVVSTIPSSSQLQCRPTIFEPLFAFRLTVQCTLYILHSTFCIVIANNHWPCSTPTDWLCCLFRIPNAFQKC